MKAIYFYGSCLLLAGLCTQACDDRSNRSRDLSDRLEEVRKETGMSNEEFNSALNRFTQGKISTRGSEDGNHSEDVMRIAGVPKNHIIDALENTRSQDLIAALHCAGILHALNRGDEESAKGEARLVLSEFYLSGDMNHTQLQSRVLDKIEALSEGDKKLKQLIERK